MGYYSRHESPNFGHCAGDDGEDLEQVRSLEPRRENLEDLSRRTIVRGEAFVGEYSAYVRQACGLYTQNGHLSSHTQAQLDIIRNVERDVRMTSKIGEEELARSCRQASIRIQNEADALLRGGKGQRW